MPFSRNRDPAFFYFKFKHRHYIIGHKLGGNRMTDQPRELVPAQGEVLLNLNHSDSVPAALRLKREDVVRASSIYPDINLVGLNLAHLRHCRSQMVL